MLLFADGLIVIEIVGVIASVWWANEGYQFSIAISQFFFVAETLNNYIGYRIQIEFFIKLTIKTNIS